LARNTTKGVCYRHPPFVSIPYKDCQGTRFEHHQEVTKPLKDTVYEALPDHHHKCSWCERTFRVYPHGVSQAQTSQLVKGLAVLLCLLGLSYEVVSLVLEVLWSPRAVLATARVSGSILNGMEIPHCQPLNRFHCHFTTVGVLMV